MIDPRAILYTVLGFGLRASGWIQYERKYESPLKPDRLVWIAPDAIERKPVETPETGTLHPTLVVGGDWDRELVPIAEDIVFRAFYTRFVEGKPWEETGYIEFLTTDVSEHGGITVEKARERCRKIDELARYIEEEGYRTQAELEREGRLIEGLLHSELRPPVYREVSVDVTRDGEFVWHSGVHRLAIARFLGVERIPVRINIRHEEWQTVRERAYTAGEHEEFHDHPDVRYLISD